MQRSTKTRKNARGRDFVQNADQVIDVNGKTFGQLQREGMFDGVVKVTVTRPDGTVKVYDGTKNHGKTIDQKPDPVPSR